MNQKQSLERQGAKQSEAQRPSFTPVVGRRGKMLIAGGTNGIRPSQQCTRQAPLKPAATATCASSIHGRFPWRLESSPIRIRHFRACLCSVRLGMAREASTPHGRSAMAHLANAKWINGHPSVAWSNKSDLCVGDKRRCRVAGAHHQGHHKHQIRSRSDPPPPPRSSPS